MQMISTHPYNTWPLHVKLFTDDAVKGWKDANKAIGEANPLPIGFTFVTELEGVDGKSGKVGSGRKGPIEVTDGEGRVSYQWMSLLKKILLFAEIFTSKFLEKHAALVSSKGDVACAVCGGRLDDYNSVC